MYDYKPERLIGHKNELFNLPHGISQAANLSSRDQEYFEYLEHQDIEAVNKQINEWRNTQLQSFLNGEVL